VAARAGPEGGQRVHPRPPGATGDGTAFAGVSFLIFVSTALRPRIEAARAILEPGCLGACTTSRSGIWDTHRIPRTRGDAHRYPLRLCIKPDTKSAAARKALARRSSIPIWNFARLHRPGWTGGFPPANTASVFQMELRLPLFLWRTMVAESRRVHDAPRPPPGGFGRRWCWAHFWGPVFGHLLLCANFAQVLGEKAGQLPVKPFAAWAPPGRRRRFCSFAFLFAPGVDC